MIPDWRDASAYPRPDTPPQWFAWEFLRRNPEYIAGWQRFAALGQPEDDDAEIQQERAASAIARPWGLSWPADPASDALPDWEKSTARIHLPGPGDDHLTPTASARTGKVAYTFDLSMPIAPQIESAINHLRRRAARWRRDNPQRAPAPSRAGKADGGRFVEMLRILDADARDAKPADIIAALWPGEPNGYPDYPLRKRLNERRRAAHEYRGGKYRELPLRATYAPPTRKIKSLSVNKGVHCSSVRAGARDGGRRWRKQGWNHGLFRMHFGSVSSR